MPRYVQHESGIGELWRLTDDQPPSEPLWKVYGKGIYVAFLPKSEYREVPPPERWVDVTQNIEWDGSACLYHKDGCSIGDIVVSAENGYRFRKVQLWRACENTAKFKEQSAFVIEKKEE